MKYNRITEISYNTYSKLNEKLIRISLQEKKISVKVHRIIIKFRKTKSFRIMSKITVNPKDKSLTKMELR